MLVLAFRSCSRLCLVSKLPTHSSIVSHCSAVFCRQQFRVRHPLETKKLAKPSVRLLSFCSACSVCRVGSWWRLIRFVALKNRLDNRSESQYGANKYMCQHFYFLIIIWWWDIAFHLLPEHELHAWMLALMCEFVLPWLNSNPWHHGISSVHHSDNGRSMTTTTTSIQENLLNLCYTIYVVYCSACAWQEYPAIRHHRQFGRHRLIACECALILVAIQIQWMRSRIAFTFLD